MQSLNVLIAGSGKSAPLIQKSKLLNKLYVTSDTEIPGATNITYNTFEELAKKCRALQIDIVVVDSEELFFAGFADTLRKHRINCIGVSEKWAQFAYSGRYAKKFLNRYDIINPLVLTFPKTFPLVLKVGRTDRVANSVEELVRIRETEIPQEFGKDIFLEEYVEGESRILYSLFDGENLLSFPLEGLSREQQSAFDEYQSKLHAMLKEEKADFMGFLNTKLVWANSKWYACGFSLDFPENTCDKDILYVLVAAIYQKLNEVSFGA